MIAWQHLPAARTPCLGWDCHNQILVPCKLTSIHNKLQIQQQYTQQQEQMPMIKMSRAGDIGFASKWRQAGRSGDGRPYAMMSYCNKTA